MTENAPIEEDSEQERQLWADLDGPVALASFWGDDNLYTWQINTLTELAKAGSKILLVTCNEAGKTSVIVADGGLGFMCKYPGCQVVSTAGAFRQISEQLWPVVGAKTGKYPDWVKKEDKLIAPAIDGLPSSTWSIFSTDDPNKAEGYHSRRFKDKYGVERYCPLVYIIDEAKAVDKGIFQAMYKCDPDHVLVCSTPGEEDGEFWEMYNMVKTEQARGPKRTGGPSLAAMWKLFEVGMHDCPHLYTGRKRAVREALIAEMGVDDPFIQSMVFGKFFRKGGFFIFKMDKVNIAISGTVPHMGTDRQCGVDLSGGVDEVSLSYRVGNKFEPLEAIREPDTAKASRWLESQFLKRKLKPEEIYADEGGIGQAIIDELEERGWRGINRYNFDDAPKDANKYDTAGMEDHHKLSMAINRSEIILPDDPVLMEQIRTRKFTLPNKNGNRMSLESKKALRKKGKSPDRLDSVIMASKDMPDYFKSVRKSPVLFRFMGKDMTAETLAQEMHRTVHGGSWYNNMRMEQ